MHSEQVAALDESATQHSSGMPLRDTEETLQSAHALTQWLPSEILVRRVVRCAQRVLINSSLNEVRSVRVAHCARKVSKSYALTLRDAASTLRCKSDHRFVLPAARLVRAAFAPRRSSRAQLLSPPALRSPSIADPSVLSYNEHDQQHSREGLLVYFGAASGGASGAFAPRRWAAILTEHHPPTARRGGGASVL